MNSHQNQAKLSSEGVNLIHFQRDQSGEPEQTQQLYDQVQTQLNQLDALERQIRLGLFGELGTLARQMRDYPAAILHFEAAIKLAQTLKDTKREAANRVRLGVALHHSDQPHLLSQAIVCFQTVIKTNQPGYTEYHDFAWQHLGKLWVEQREYKQAKNCFEQALKLRQSKQNAELIDSTMQALKGLEALISEI